MITRRMQPADGAQAERMWIDIFGDTESFTHWFFSERFSPEMSFAAFDGERLAAMTLGRETKILVEGKEHRALLISGVSTLQDYRGKGLMHTLVSAQIEAAKGKGFSCCYLHPVRESLYSSLGFKTGTEALTVCSDPDRMHAAFSIREGTDAASMRAVYDALLPRYNGMQIRDETEIRALLYDYGADGFHMLTAYSGDLPIGYIIVLDDGTVPELFALCTDAYAALLDEAAKRVGHELKATVPTDCGVEGERQYSMQYLVFRNAFDLPLKNGFCRLSY